MTSFVSCLWPKMLTVSTCLYQFESSQHGLKAICIGHFEMVIRLFKIERSYAQQKGRSPMTWLMISPQALSAEVRTIRICSTSTLFSWLHRSSDHSPRNSKSFCKTTLNQNELVIAHLPVAWKVRFYTTSNSYNVLSFVRDLSYNLIHNITNGVFNGCPSLQSLWVKRHINLTKITYLPLLYLCKY